ncbi:MAG: hypothetical protein AAF939_20375 [Planctomycetota bacterium]
MNDGLKKYLPYSVAFLLVTVVVAIAGKNMVVSLDLFHEMALYRQMEAEGSMPIEDDFAYTPTVKPVVHHEWATGAVLYLATVSTGWGDAGLVAIKYFLTFAVCIGCFWIAYQRRARIFVFASLAFIPLNVGGWMAFTNIRAQLFTLFFFVTMYQFIEWDRRGKKWWVILWLPMFVVWANMHAGFLAGLGILGIYGITRWLTELKESENLLESVRRVSHLLFVGFSSLLLMNVNPYGWDYIPYLIRAVSMERPLIVEWRAIWDLGTYEPLLFYSVSVLIAAYGIYQDRGKSLFPALALALTAILAAKNYRHGSLYAVTWACFVPALIEPAPLGETFRELWHRYSPQLATICTAVGIIALGLSIQNNFWELQIPGSKRNPNDGVLIYPVGAVNYLAESKFEGNVFVPFNSGAFVLWKLYPHVKVSIDSRYEVAYPHGAIEENMAFYQAFPGWTETLEKYDTDAVLIPNACDLSAVFPDHQATQRWLRAYKDSEFTLYLSPNIGNQFPVVDRSREKIVGVFP